MVRCILLATLLLAWTMGENTIAEATQATPGASNPGLMAMGYPELLITVTDDSFELPGSVEEGRYLLTFDNTGQESRHSILLRLPDDLETDLAVDLGPETEAPPAWLFEATAPGFPGETPPGERSYAVIDLEPGRYVVIDDFFATFEVLPGPEATPIPAVDPATEATVDLFEYGYELPAGIVPGRQVWEVMNSGAESHEFLLIRSPAPITTEQAMELFMAEDEEATPTGGGPTLSELAPVGGISWLSPGQTAWIDVDLQPGTYVALCFVPDPETFTPHVAMGMIAVFTIGESGTPAA